MEKRISYMDFMAVKRTAQIINPTLQKREKVRKQIEKLAEDYKAQDALIQSYEAGIKQLTGLRTEELVKKVIEPATNENGTPKLDKDGKTVKVTKYVPTSIVSYDKEHKQYVITVPDEPQPEAPEEPVSVDSGIRKEATTETANEAA